VTSQVVNQRGPGVALPRRQGAGRAPGPSPQLVFLDEAAEVAEPDEVLVIDARGALTPSRVVEQRLAALLRSVRPEPFGEAGTVRDGRRALRAREGTGPASALGRPRPCGPGSGGDRMTAPFPGDECAGKVSVVTFTGLAGREQGDRLAAELEGRAEGALGGHLLLDFVNVHFINSEELGALVGLHTAVNAAGGQLTLFNLSARLYQVFTVARLPARLATCPSWRFYDADLVEEKPGGRGRRGRRRLRAHAQSYGARDLRRDSEAGLRDRQSGPGPSLGGVGTPPRRRRGGRPGGRAHSARWVTTP
jgi:anti-anti-sigma factor